MADKKEKVVEAGAVNPDDLFVIAMCCCGVSSLYCNCPDCLGCYTTSVCCCQENQSKCCKPHDNPDKICICNSTDCNCIYVTTCCKQTSQCCCCDNRTAFPCDDDVPCGLAALGLVCCFNWGCKCACCSTIGDLRGTGKEGAAKEGARI